MKSPRSPPTPIRRVVRRPALPRYLGLTALLACGGQGDDPRPVSADSVGAKPPADSLVLRSKMGTEVWFTLARQAVNADGRRCVERGLEIRNGQSRVKVPLLYTATPPVLVNDSTMRAMLWTHCQPGDPYLINLRSGHPVRERPANTS
jgi:hypothetical protein